mgnify:CR=1 FL=1
MDDYQTEEEQVESIKKWWRENSRAIIVGVTIGLVGIFSWQSWQDYTYQHAEEASDFYQQVIELSVDNGQEAIELINEIELNYNDTVYAALAGLQKAKLQLIDGKPAEATVTLDNVFANSSNSSLAHIAHLRALRLKVGSGERETVITTVSQVLDGELGIAAGSFAAQYHELHGDVYRLMGDLAKARVSYQQALLAAREKNQLTQLKLDDLGGEDLGFKSVSEPADTVEGTK